MRFRQTYILYSLSIKKIKKLKTLLKFVNNMINNCCIFKTNCIIKTQRTILKVIYYELSVIKTNECFVNLCLEPKLHQNKRFLCILTYFKLPTALFKVCF